MKLRFFAFSFFLCLLLTLSAAASDDGCLLQKTAEYTVGIFDDVDENNVFASEIALAYETGLMRGTSTHHFGATGTLTNYASLMIACRLHSQVTYGTDVIPASGDSVAPKRNDYLSYATENGIYQTVDDWSKPTTRAVFAQMLSSAFPDSALEQMNDICDGEIPDVEGEYTTAVYRLYRAGVLTGTNSYGLFRPNDTITRGAACAIVARMADPALRKEQTIPEGNREAYQMNLAQAAQEVTTASEDVMLTSDVTVYLYSNLEGPEIGTKTAGTHAAFLGAMNGKSACLLFDDGMRGWVLSSSFSYTWSYHTIPWNYSVDVKEYYVNQKGWGGGNGYLIWVSLSTQQVTVFTGTKGNWKALYTWDCCAGAYATKTRLGTFAVSYKTPIWNFGSYYVTDVTGFDGSIAFHTITYSPNGDVLDGTTGSPGSHGCVRLPKQAAKWIYETIPIGTTVVVY